MPYKLKFDTGETVSFENEPTDADVEEVVKKLGIKPKSASIPETSPIQQKQDYSGIGSSVTNFGKSIAQTGYRLAGGQKKIDTITKQYMDNGDKLFQLAQKQADPERKKQLLLQAQGMYGDAEKVGGDILGNVRSQKQVIADALGTLGFATLAGTPTALGGGLKAGGALASKLGAKKAVSTIGGRLALGTTFGAGAGAQQALGAEKSVGEIAKSTAIGAGVGLAVGGAVEGIGALLRKAVQTKPVQKLIGNVYNRELQPPTKDMVADLERHAQSIGQRVANETDDTGKAIYKGGYDTMARQAEGQISKNANLLKSQLKNVKTTIKAQSFKEQLLSKLKDEFGFLDDGQLATIEAEIKKLPPKMNPLELLNQRQIVDSKIPKGFWIEPNPQRAFVGNVRYYLRGLMKNSIEQLAPTTPVKQLNQKIGLAIDVKDLAYLQEAIRMKGRGVASIGFWKPIAYALDRTIFNPQITTRVAQGIKKLGQKSGNIPLRNITTGITNKAQE